MDAMLRGSIGCGVARVGVATPQWVAFVDCVCSVAIGAGAMRSVVHRLAVTAGSI